MNNTNVLQSLYLIVALALSLASVGVHGQTGFGIRAGVLFANQDFESIGLGTDAKGKLGLDLGVVYNARLGNGFFVQPEVRFAQMGFTFDGLSITDLDANLNYVRIPILIKYDLLQDQTSLTISPFIGPYLGILVSTDIDLDNFFNENLYQSTDAGAELGIMVNTRGGFFIDVRYLLGIQNIIDLEQGEIRNKALNFGVGYIF